HPRSPVPSPPFNVLPTHITHAAAQHAPRSPCAPRPCPCHVAWRGTVSRRAPPAAASVSSDVLDTRPGCHAHAHAHAAATRAGVRSDTRVCVQLPLPRRIGRACWQGLALVLARWMGWGVVWHVCVGCPGRVRSGDGMGWDGSGVRREARYRGVEWSGGREGGRASSSWVGKGPMVSVLVILALDTLLLNASLELNFAGSVMGCEQMFGDVLFVWRWEAGYERGVGGGAGLGVRSATGCGRGFPCWACGYMAAMGWTTAGLHVLDGGGQALVKARLEADTLR
ncbi:hypothetical protein P171DRAFT_510470, partial [Karstenula rhodostoma CBS 690.94]